MKELINNIEKLKNTFWFFGAKSILIDIIYDLLGQLEMAQTENELLRNQPSLAPPAKNITAEEIRDKLHSLTGKSRLSANYIQNINTNLSADDFQEIIVDGVKIIALKSITNK